MSYQWESKGGPGLSLEFTGEPSYCCSLAAEGALLPTRLRRGKWLVLFVAVWSAPDLDAVAVAIAAVKRLRGRVKLGVRPFDDHEEIRAWFPSIAETSGSPVWALIDHGAVAAVDVGLRTVDDLERAMRRELLAESRAG